MAQERAPIREQSLLDDGSKTTSWDMARERLENPEVPRTYWLATVRPDGAPHLMPVIAFWLDGALNMVVGEGTRKARNLAANSRAVVATGSTKLPSLDIIVEGQAQPLTDEAEVSEVVEFLGTANWPLEAKGDKVYGPNAPTAGPPPYRIFRLVPSRVFGLPGMLGMDEAEGELPKPTRWDFTG